MNRQNARCGAGIRAEDLCGITDGLARLAPRCLPSDALCRRVALPSRVRKLFSGCCTLCVRQQIVLLRDFVAAKRMDEAGHGTAAVPRPGLDRTRPATVGLRYNYFKIKLDPKTKEGCSEKVDTMRPLEGDSHDELTFINTFLYNVIHGSIFAPWLSRSPTPGCPGEWALAWRQETGRSETLTGGCRVRGRMPDSDVDEVAEEEEVHPLFDHPWHP